MKVDLFDFDLPAASIAERPCEPREAAKLLAIRNQSLKDHFIADLPALLEPGDLMVFNDAKVLPSQLSGARKSDQRNFEFTLHKHLDVGIWRAFAKPARKLKAGDDIVFSTDVMARVLAKNGGEIDLDFQLNDNELIEFLKQTGEMPLPPYIRKNRAVDGRDEHDYQTIYSRVEGAVAAPTAGLHFTQNLLDKLHARGIQQTMVTLLVGAGTFLPIKVDDSDDHKMHAEFGEISSETAELINSTRARGGKIIAVGTTSLRLLESAAAADGTVSYFRGDTDIFITPGYQFKVVDQLLSNFHLPRSTLFMLVSAFCGLAEMQAAYGHAVARDYRFYSYGDACLLWRKEAG
jgi:S-adenosylmethionine:tRNA ribosyltransferase-isomerase